MFSFQPNAAKVFGIITDLKVLNSDIFDETVTSKTSENPFISIAFTKGRPLVISLKILAIFAYYAKK